MSNLEEMIMRHKLGNNNDDDMLMNFVALLGFI